MTLSDGRRIDGRSVRRRVWWRWLAVLAASAIAVGGLGPLTPATAQATLLYVAQGGSDGNSCLTPAASCATITRALTQAAAGATIQVSGTITNRVTVTASLSPITISGVTPPAGSPAPSGSSPVVSGNTGATSGAVITINSGVTANLSNLTVSNGSNTGPGGGIRNSGTLRITNSTISNNSTSDTFGGGGIYSTSPNLTIVNSTISGNTASAAGGGGIQNAANPSGFAVTLTDSTISDNRALAGAGGGISNGNASRVTVTNSTISGNTSSSTGGGLYTAGDATVTGSTISGNTASSIGGITNVVLGVGAGGNNTNTVTLRATIVATNTGGNCTGPRFTSLGRNLTSDAAGAACGFTQSTDVVNADPLLGPLASNGGPTQTRLPSSSSPAVARIPNPTTLGGVAVCGGGATDQRGTSRPVSSGPCTIGAVEVAGVAPQITSAASTTFAVGSAGSFTVTTTGVPAPTLSLSGGSLPSGVTFTNNGNGTATLAGTPAAGTGGTYVRTITASNGVGSAATQSFTLTVNQPLGISSSASTTFTVGVAGTFTVTTSGFPASTRTLSVSGALPAGVGFVDNGNGTATLSGTPGAGTGGVYPLTITATNTLGQSAMQSFTLTVNQAPAITSAASTTFTVGSSGTFMVTTSGFPTPPTLSSSGPLPSGVTFTNNGNGTATLAGTPGAGTGGTRTLTFTASNGVNPPATQTFTLTVNQAPAITSSASTTFTVGSTGTFMVTTNGFPTPTSLSASGPLPSGVIFANNGNGTATLSGTPGAGTGGTYSLTVTASNGVSPAATQTFTLTVNQAPAITSAASTTFTVGTAGSFTVTTSGFPVAGLSDSGTLPGGVTFTDNGNGTATLAGVPAVGTAGTYVLTFTADNGVSPAATQSFTLTVNQAPAITSPASTTFTVGAAGSFTVTASGFPTPAPALTETGALPGGVTFTGNGNGTATLAGTPAAGTGGSYVLTFTASNGVSPAATQTFTLTVNEAPAITSPASTTFTVGTAESFRVTTSGFPAPALSETGALPGGVTFVDNGDGTATLAGTPLAGTGGTYVLTLAADNGVSPPAMQSFTLTVNQAPAITSPATTTFTVGAAGSFTVTTNGFPTPTPALSETGVLPGGVSFTDNGNGTATLAGTPAAGTGGTYQLIITADNGVNPASVQDFTLIVSEAPAITSAASTTFTVGSAGTFVVTTSGFPAAALSASGTLPTGVTFTPNGHGTATLAGTPAAGTGGSYVLLLTADNGVSPPATQSFTLTVDEAPAFTSAAAATFTVGAAGSFTVTTSGFPTPAPALSETGALPGGVVFVNNGNGTATLSGTPVAGTGGTYQLTFTADNGVTPAATQSFTLTVNEAPAITSAASTTFTVGTAGSFMVTTSGFPPAALSESGALPAGVTFTNDANGTATLAGTPAAGTGGTYPLTITADNGVDPATQAFTLTVHEAPAVTSAASTTFTVGSAGTFTVTTSGFPTAALSESGSLPSGLAFVDTGNGTATLSGTPAAGTGGTYPLTITASNGVGQAAEQDFVLTVNEAPAVTSAASTTFTVGTTENFTVTTSGFPTPAAVGVSGALPVGVTFTNNGNGTATVSGDPAAGTGGAYPLVFTASNGVGSPATQDFTLTVNEPPAITSAAATTFTVGSAGTFTVTTAGFPAPISTIGESGVLPAGVSFTDNGNGTATLSGTPAVGAGGVYPLIIAASNGVGMSATQDFTLTVNEAPTITSAASTLFTVGSDGVFVVTTIGFPTPALSASGTLPVGVAFTDNGDGTATIVGTPAPGSEGVFHLTISAENGVGPPATQGFVLTLNAAPMITSVASTTFRVGTAGTFTVTSVGFPTPTLSEGGGLPAGVRFTDHGDGTATLAGTPAAGTARVYHLTITAQNGVSPAATQAFTLTVNPPPGFHREPGSATDVGVGANGSVWVVGTNAVPGGFGIWRFAGTGWVAVPGGGVSIAVDPAGNPWVTNSLHQIWRWTGHAFVHVPGQATDVGVGADGSVWVVGTNPAPGGFGISQITAAGTVPVAGGAVSISVDPAGNPWVTNSLHQIWRWTGHAFVRVAGSATDIGVGANSAAWTVGTNPTPGGFGISQITTTGHQPVSGGAIRIAVNPAGNPWVTNSLSQIFSFH